MSTAEDDVIQAWLATKKKSTQKVYGLVVDEFRKGIQKPLMDVTTAEVERWLKHWIAVHEVATAARKLRTLRSLYRFGQMHAGWPHNPCFIQDPKVKDNLQDRIPSLEEVWALIAAAEQRSPFLTGLVTFVFGTGCRINELVAATWASIVPDSETVWRWHIPHRDPAVTLSLRPEVVAALKTWRAAQGLDPEQWPRNDTTPLFPNKRGEPSKPVTLTAAIRRLSQAIGRDHKHLIPAFGLRHAHADLALKHGAPLGVVQETLGHHRRASTERYLPQNVASADFIPWDSRRKP